MSSSHNYPISWRGNIDFMPPRMVFHDGELISWREFEFMTEKKISWREIMRFHDAEKISWRESVIHDAKKFISCRRKISWRREGRLFGFWITPGNGCTRTQAQTTCVRQKQRHKPRTFQSMANTLQVDGLARIIGLTQARDRTHPQPLKWPPPTPYPSDSGIGGD